MKSNNASSHGVKWSVALSCEIHKGHRAFYTDSCYTDYNKAPQARTSRVTFASSVGLYTSVQFLGLKVKWCYLVLDRGALFFIMAACYFCNMVIWLNTIKYSSNWSPLLPGWVRRWLNVDVSILEHIQMSFCFCWKGCCVWLWSEALKHYLASPSLEVSLFKHNRFDSLLVRWGPACLH